MKRTIKLLVLAVCLALFICALVSCGCSNGSSCTHEWNSGNVTKNPTCLAEGTKTYTCTLCSDTYTESIAKLDHSKLYVDALDGTHNESCSYCTYDEYVSHTPSGEGTHYDASCDEGAYTLHTCKDCNANYKAYDEGSEALGHDWGDWVVEIQANCKTKGKSTHTCKACPETETITIDENPDVHAYGNGATTQPATCVSVGEKLFICSLCGNEHTVDIPKTTQHTWSDGESDGTGWVTQSCSVTDCNESRKYYDASTLVNADVTIDELPDEDVELGLQNATIQLPSDVVSQIKEETGDKVEISAAPADKSTIDTSSMTDEEKERLESTDVYDFGITVGGNSIGNFASKVTVTIPYKLGENEDSEGIVIWYVSDSGKIEIVEATYDETSETVTFSVEHFSYYAVAYKETQAMKCKRGVHAMKETTITREPSCYSYGYTVFQCECCLTKEIGKIQNRLEHNFGPFQEAEVTCETGGYKYRVCQNENCGYVKTAEYVRATGHKISSVPTCTEGVYCETCQKMVKSPLGHDYTAWTITKNPTQTENGEKTRTCRKCENVEKVTIAAGTGVDAAHLESYKDLFEFVLLELFGGETRGTTTITYTINGVDATSKITLDASENNFKAYIETEGISVEPSYDGTVNTEKMTIRIFYDNGICYLENLDNYKPMVAKTDINSAFLNSTGMPFDVLYATMEAYFSEVNSMIEEYDAMINSIISVIPEKFAGRIPELYNAIETTYTYLALRLGFDTNIKMADQTVAPTAKDVIEAFGTLLTKQEVNGETVYTFDLKVILDEIKATLKTLKENEGTSLGAFIYTQYEEAIKEIYPDVTSFESLMTKLSEDFSGETKVGDAFVKLCSYLLKLDFTVDEIYEVFDAIMAKLMPEQELPEGSAYHDMITQYANLTLDELLPMLMASMPNGSPDNGYDDSYDSGYNGSIGGNDYVSGGTDSESGLVPDDYYGEDNYVGGDTEEGGSDNEYVGDDVIVIDPVNDVYIDMDNNTLVPDTEYDNSYDNGSDYDDSKDIIYGSDYVSGGMDNDSGLVPDDGYDEEMSSLTMADLWAQVGGMLSEMTLGDITVPVQGNEMTFTQLIETAEQMLTAYEIDVKASFTVGSNGNLKLVSLSGLAGTTMQNPENPEETTTVELVKFSLSYDSSKVEIVLPETIRKYTNTNVNYHFDNEGNLIINGVNGKDFEISLDGYIEAPLSEILTKDEALSKELGVEVYYRQYTSKNHYSSYIKVGDKYYQYNYVPDSFVSEDKESLIPDPILDKNLKLTDIIANPSIVLPTEDTLPIGTYKDFDLYHTPIGFVYMDENGEWMILDDFNLDSYIYHDSEYNNNTETVSIKLRIRNGVSSYSFNEAVNNLMFYMIDGKYSDYYYENVSLFGGQLDFNIRRITLTTSGSDLSYLHAFGYFNNDELYLVSYKPVIYSYRYTNYVCVLTEDATDKVLSGDYKLSDDELYWNECYLNGKLVKNVRYVSTYKELVSYEYYYKVDNNKFVRFNNSGIESGIDVSLYDTQLTLPNDQTFYVKTDTGYGLLFGYVPLGNNYYAQAYAVTNGDSVTEYGFRNAVSNRTFNYYSDSYNINNLINIENYTTKANDTIIISKDFFDKLNKLCVSKHLISLSLIYNETVEIGEEDSYTYTEMFAPLAKASMPKVSLGGSSASANRYIDWSNNFEDSYIKFNISANNDGSVSIYYNGKKLELRYSSVSNIPVDSIGSVNQELSNEFDADIYEVEEKTYSSSYFTFVGGKLYNYSYVSNYKVAYMPSAPSLKITDWAYTDLRYMASSDVDGTIYSIYETVIWCKNAYDTFKITAYTTFVDGELRILGGCENIGDDSVKFETLVEPDNYFPNLMIILPTANELSSSFSGIVNTGSAPTTFYYGYASIYEPSSICLEGDNLVSSYLTYATMNGSRVSYINDYSYLGTSLVLGSVVTEKNLTDAGYSFFENETRDYYNGTFVIQEFRKANYNSEYYIKIAGKFYDFENYYWYNDIMLFEAFAEAFYDKTYLYGVVDENGNIILYTGDEYGTEAIEYTGELRAEDADVVNVMDAGFIEGYDTVYQYIFYSVPQDSMVVEIDGTEVYISASGNAYAKINDNAYVSGAALENEDGAYTFDPNYFYEANISGSETIKEIANKLITSNDKNVYTISKEFYEIFAGATGEIFVYNAETNSSIGSISMEDLLAHFELANEKQ
ncbi:MAG: hypothetical protein IJW54_00035 [Clostridia bacterium]|nr:hypothetical protein [Clostridia bacterium]